MPPYLRDAAVWANVWPPLFGAGVIAGVLWLVTRRQWFLPLYAFTILGFVTGLVMGNSRAPVAGAVIPAILTLVGGLTIYLVAKDEQRRQLVAACVIGLAISVWIGAMWGAILNEAATVERPVPRAPGVTPPITIPPDGSPSRDMPSPMIPAPRP